VFPISVPLIWLPPLPARHLRHGRRRRPVPISAGGLVPPLPSAQQEAAPTLLPGTHAAAPVLGIDPIRPWESARPCLVRLRPPRPAAGGRPRPLIRLQRIYNF
jgi:hypothetical protein